MSVAVAAHAQDATWLQTPGSADFNTAANWSPATVPTGTASFDTSSQTNVSFSANTTIGGWTFNPGASNYNFTNGQILQFNGAGIVIDGGSATITNHNNLTFLGTSTAGSAAITNNNALFFSGTSTAGNAAIANNNALQFSDNSTAGAAAIASNGTVQFLDTSTAGAASITSSGTVQFLDTSTAGAASITSNGTVQFFANSTAGTASIANNDTGVVQFSNTSTAGSAVIANNSNGNVQFFDTSTAGSATITNNARLQFRDTSTAGTATITNTNSNTGALQFLDTSTAGSASITNNGVLQFFNTSTAGTATITNTGVLQFLETSTAGSAAITNNNVNTGMAFRGSSTAGNATITNNGVLDFLETSTAGSATITNNDRLIFLETSTAGSAAIANNGFLQFGNTSTGGTARFINGAAGTIDLSALTNPGMTAGSIEGAGFILLGEKNLAVGGNNRSTTFSGVLQDGGVGGGVRGSLTKTGTGTLTLSGTNAYTGATTVDAGTLLVNGSIASSSLTTVNAGGTLGGNGTVGNTTINDGGTLAPGTSIGTLTIQGNLVMASAAAYLVEVTPTNADRVDVTGTATLGGTVRAVFAPGSYVTRQYTILHTSAANGLGGTQFAGVTSNVPGFGVSLSYVNDQDVILNLTATLGQGAGLNRNQQNVATAINGFFNNGGALPPNFVNVFGLTGGNLANTLSLLSGEAATGARQGAFQLGGQFLGLMLDPFVGRGGMDGGGPALGFAPERAALPDDPRSSSGQASPSPTAR